MRPAAALVGLGLALECLAGNTSGAFSVTVSVSAAGSSPTLPAGVCLSQSLSQESGAIVTVVCNSGQFVNISPIPGARFVGTHGGAYTYSFGSSFGSGAGDLGAGTGSIASFRVFGVTESEGRLDLLVSF